MNMDFVSSKMVPNNESTIVAPYIEIKDIHHDHIYIYLHKNTIQHSIKTILRY